MQGRANMDVDFSDRQDEPIQAAERAAERKLRRLLERATDPDPEGVSGLRARVDHADGAPIGMGFVGADRDWSVKPYPFDRAPQVAPLAADTDIGFVDVPIDARPSKVLLGSLGQ